MPRQRPSAWMLFSFFSLVSYSLGAAPPSSPAPAAAPAPASRYQETLSAAKALVASPEAGKRIGDLADSLSPQEALVLLAELAPAVSDPGQSKALLQRAGRLALLLGSYAQAADLLEAAAFRQPASRDDSLLLASARCRLAAGDSDKAGDRAAIVARSATSPNLVLGARLVTAWASLLTGEAALAKRAALALLEGPAKAGPASAERREALFILWAASPQAEKAGVAASLLKDYPGSPEAALAENPASANLPYLPHWYLSGALVPSEGPKEDPKPPVPVAEEEASARKFQVGIFSDSQNAADLVAELAKKGIQGRLEKRTVSGKELFAVIVEGESNATILRLKDAGYEAWPLF